LGFGVYDSDDSELRDRVGGEGDGFEVPGSRLIVVGL